MLNAECRVMIEGGCGVVCSPQLHVLLCSINSPASFYFVLFFLLFRAYGTFPRLSALNRTKQKEIEEKTGGSRTWKRG
jgi:hypothetical protein